MWPALTRGFESASDRIVPPCWQCKHGRAHMHAILMCGHPHPYCRPCLHQWWDAVQAVPCSFLLDRTLSLSHLCFRQALKRRPQSAVEGLVGMPAT